MSSHRVLLVDDDDFTRMTVRAVLVPVNYDVIGDAANVVAAMDIARAGRPDLAVIDLDLGEGPTGIDLAHGLRTLLPAPNSDDSWGVFARARSRPIAVRGKLASANCSVDQRPALGSVTR